MSDEYRADRRYEPKDQKAYGIKRRSGRFPWGSGGEDTNYHRSMRFYDIVDGYKAQGLSEPEIAKAVGLSVADLRSTRTIAKEEIVLEQTNRAVALRDKGVSINEIASQLDMEPPTVRLRLKNSENMKKSALTNTADVLRKNVDEHDIVDIGKGVEHQLGIADTKLKAALSLLRDEGYETHTIPVRQPGTQQFTNQKVLVKPGVSKGDAMRMRDQIHTMGDWTENEGLTYFGIRKPLSVSPNRLKVNFAEDGGTAEDGVVYVKPGVKDLNMGKNTYAQVRIQIGEGHFIKGMAVVKHDMPADGPDLIFNTNKSKTVGKLGALKPLVTDKDGNVDQDNPFGSVIKRQILGVDPKTGEQRAVSAMNIVNETGDWDTWRKSLPSQMLAKQPHSLIKSQLKETREQTVTRLSDIEKITNPVIRQKKLEDFAEQIDADAVDLRAASMPRQATKVIIPMTHLKKNEIYAPTFDNGEPVVLIRYPHGGKFEIPEVTVNNLSRKSKAILGNAHDAIGIHPSVAERLSGADFDGDTVVVIPNRSGKIKGSKALGPMATKVYEEGLNDFDPKRKYGGFVQTGEDSKGRPTGNFKLMTQTGLEMGMITNLITDMSIQGAQPDHVVRAVRHSMVVIDAEKHKLNYKQSEIDNGIAQLKTLYQGSPKSGATTLLSQATAKKRVPDFKPRPMKLGGPIDPDTGARINVPTGKTRSVYDPKTQTYSPDKRVPVEKQVKRLALTDDAYTLVRDKADPVERLYADHANEMKALANEARLRAVNTSMPKINPKAKEVYRPEVDKLVADLKSAQMQKPLERKAQIVANGVIKAKRQEDPLLRVDPDRLKKVEKQAKEYARARLNLTKPVIEITDRQWDAIQAGAVSASRLRDILEYADPKRIDELSMPRHNTVMTSAVTARAKAMLSAGATNAEVAALLGIPQSTLRAAALRGEV